jgi:hypothetical protein
MRNVRIQSVLLRVLSVMNSAYRYGLLVLLLGILAERIQWYISLPPTYEGDRYGGAIVVMALLFNHLACEFKWRFWIRVAFRVLAVGWVIFVGFYFFY